MNFKYIYIQPFFSKSRDRWFISATVDHYETVRLASYIGKPEDTFWSPFSEGYKTVLFDTQEKAEQFLSTEKPNLLNIYVLTKIEEAMRI